MIAWGDLFKDVFEFIANLHASNNFWKRDLEFSSDTPLSATTDSAITLINSGSIDRVNTDMHMNFECVYFALGLSHSWIVSSSNDSMSSFLCCFYIAKRERLSQLMKLFFSLYDSYNTVIWFHAFSLHLLHSQLT